MSEKGQMTELIAKAREICHDLNQPLTVIMGRSELILIKLPPDDPNRASIEQINEQAKKASSHVQDLQALLKGFQAD